MTKPLDRRIEGMSVREAREDIVFEKAKYAEWRDANILRMHDKGWPIDGIAKILHLSEAGVRNVIAKDDRS